MKRPYPISVQLYSLREEAAVDFFGVLKKVAAIGYTGVELAGLHGKTAQQVRVACDNLGLVISSAHGSFPTAESVNRIVEDAQTMGYTIHVAGLGRDMFASEQLSAQAGAKFETAAQLLHAHGLRFAFHNHDWEFDNRFGGKLPHTIALEQGSLATAQLDTYWVKVGGEDPAAVIMSAAPRVPLLHIKDGSGQRTASMTAVGKGLMDWSTVFTAADRAGCVEWAIVELDRCDTDMLTAVSESYRYLVGEGYCRGNR